MSERIEKLISDLTLDEKAAVAAGVDLWHGPGIDRLGVPALKVTDGPSGARGEQWSGRPSANFPCGTALGATWNTELVHEVGKRLGVETRRKQAHALLAPTVNIHRHPLAGRNFECYSEDPWLSARMAVAYITGVQSQGVGCTVKHFVANDSEFERMTISSEVDERTLREISLVPFEAAVVEAGTWALMTAYNRVNGSYASEHAELIAILRDEWGFDGLVMSDWYGLHSTVPAANAGLDLEMPGPPQFFGEKLAAAVRAGEVRESVLDDKAHRVLMLIERTGRLDDERPQEVCIDDPIDRAIARRAARESFVLLRNERAALPITPAIKTLAVIGPNADATVIQGGGSARVTPHPPVSPLAGLRARFEPAGVEVVHERGCYSFKRTPILETGPVLQAPLTVEYFAGREREGDPAYVEESARGLFTFIGPVGNGVPDEFSLKARGTIAASETGEWTFTLVQVGRARLTIDGELVVDNWNPVGRSDAFMGYGSGEAAGSIELTAGEPHTLEVEFVPPRGLGGLEIGCRPPAPPDLMDRAVALARRADSVICIVGTDNDWETEGHDRESMALPPPQDELVRAVAAANPNTVVVINAASPVEMPWADDVAAIVQAWFPGEEWGNALADVVSGDESPSGKLPTTIPVRIEDTPAFTNYPGERGQVRYGEGVFVGYRWYDARRIEPRYCFGHGLSYTTFELGAPTWDGESVHVSVTNTGATRGAETVQCYVRDAEASVARPEQELKAFAKVWLDPGESRAVRLPLDERSFSFWDVVAHAWTAEPGEFELRIGTSSRAIAHRLTIERA
ncbi:MAG TPA: glycoside hydrolase family 3 C-terminal domain-containing protein [Acidimicrobiia bacterium]|nr:glycoside hydrolase family 3 C-terminal domain-containing protein [Acidimicrobiia bacterium]